MTAVQLPEFSTTPVEQIPSIVSRLRSSFFSQKTRPAAFRLRQLRKLYWAIADHEEELLEACKRDLGKGIFEAMVSEIEWVKNDICFMTQNLERWMKDEKPEDMAWTHKFVSPRIRKDPLGVVLVIGAFNFPINLAFGPMIGAIAAGNTVVLKPSEQCPNCAAMMQLIMEKALDPECYACVQGGIPETSALLEQNWDKIFFTGSVNTAKIVAQAAAKNLTPVALELGGKNPAIVTKKADVQLAARRLLWAKTMNAGQVCISQNYILVDKEVAPTLITELKAAMKEFFPSGAKQSPDYSRIVNLRAFNRIKKMLDSTSGKIVAGGTMDADQLFIEPTVIEVSDPKDPLIVEESFGPLIPVLPVDNLDQAISIANETHATPLGVYAFGSKAETDRVLAETRSGGASINDGFFHGVIPTLAFGGVGDSGTGAYRGKASFDCFTHRRSITKTPNWMEKLLAVRYPPFDGTSKLKQYRAMGILKPDFDRDGRQKIGLLWYLITLGSGSASKGALRAALIAGIYLALRALMEGRIWKGLKG
ncbi:aldehyde dehydrogenase (NAD(P)+) [Capronia coronata CBS 617.96]|uniref:Aldehyde dehydrogenase n=1 Tax=Capronia coronata CBS 617.96 TaxID=1182541 RepID=W9Z166_9EURO|nr:aldehyde dehydrogenase (NAD(P)+) [Capronia coronata CBS 617.96]EXJ95705.1 aldehyde dehydrogenase (NAD(P)+) [Capronia coronata CBS 617.96]